MKQVDFDKMLTITDFGRTRGCTRARILCLGTAEVFEAWFSVDTPCVTYRCDLRRKRAFAVVADNCVENTAHLGIQYNGLS